MSKHKKRVISANKKSWIIINLENWAWAEGHLGNIAKEAHQLNLLGEKIKSEAKRGEEKNKGTKRREGREKRNVGVEKSVKK